MLVLHQVLSLTALQPERQNEFDSFTVAIVIGLNCLFCLVGFNVPLTIVQSYEDGFEKDSDTRNLGAIP